MESFLFYIKIGLQHVLDLRGYDHILFLIALAIPFSFAHWRRVILLVTVFTIAHCLSLALSVFGWVNVNVSLVEFLIPVTIALTAISNLVEMVTPLKNFKVIHLLLTAFFGLIHGFGFSNYFKMLMSGEEEQLIPLLGFASGIEISQVIVITAVLGLGWFLISNLHLKRATYVVFASTIILLITIPLMVHAFPH